MKGEKKTDLLEVKLFRLEHPYGSNCRLWWSELDHWVQRACSEDDRMMRHIHLRRF